MVDNLDNGEVDVQVRLATARWVLERQLGWIAAAEVKVGVIVAIDTALLAGLAAAFGASDVSVLGCWTYAFTLGAAGAAVIGLLCSALAVIPRTKGPKESLLFFGQVSALDVQTYAARFRSASAAQMLTDMTTQIHRNAEIARDKYVWVRRSMSWSFFSAILWVAALGLLVKL